MFLFCFPLVIYVWLEKTIILPLLPFFHIIIIHSMSNVSPSDVSLWSETLWRNASPVIGHSQLVCPLASGYYYDPMFMHDQSEPILGKWTATYTHTHMDTHRPTFKNKTKPNKKKQDKIKEMIIIFGGWVGGFIGSATGELVKINPSRQTARCFTVLSKITE